MSIRCLFLLALLLATGKTLPAQSAPAEPDDPAVEAQCRMYFPPEGPPATRYLRPGIILVTDAKPDQAPLLNKLSAAGRLLAAWTAPAQASSRLAAPASRPTAPVPASRPAGPRPVCLALYKDAPGYERLWIRVLAYYGGGQFATIGPEGFSYRCFCASYVSATAPPLLEGLLVHEFTHVWLYQNARLPNNGNWLTEGIASAMQMRAAPASANRAEFAQWVAEKRYVPLKRVMDQEHLDGKDYWQAAALAEMLAQRRGVLAKVIAAQREGMSSQRIVADVLRTDWTELTRQWESSVRSHAAD